MYQGYFQMFKAKKNKVWIWISKENVVWKNKTSNLKEVRQTILMAGYFQQQQQNKNVENKKHNDYD